MEDPLTGVPQCSAAFIFSVLSDYDVVPLCPDAVMLCAAGFPRRNADEEEEREKAREWAECPPAPPTLEVRFCFCELYFVHICCTASKCSSGMQWRGGAVAQQRVPADVLVRSAWLTWPQSAWTPAQRA